MEIKTEINDSNEYLYVKKRDRGSNFSELERSILIYTIDKYKDIIESRRSNTNVIKQKEETWRLVVSEYNASVGVTRRTAKQLKNCYLNLKRDMKKRGLDFNSYLTNGLPLPADESSTSESAGHPTQILPHKNMILADNPFDSDSPQDFEAICNLMEDEQRDEYQAAENLQSTEENSLTGEAMDDAPATEADEEPQNSSAAKKRTKRKDSESFLGILKTFYERKSENQKEIHALEKQLLEYKILASQEKYLYYKNKNSEFKDK